LQSDWLLVIGDLFKNHMNGKTIRIKYGMMRWDRVIFNGLLSKLTKKYNWVNSTNVNFICGDIVFELVIQFIELDDGKILQENPIFDGKNHGFL